MQDSASEFQIINLPRPAAYLRIATPSKDIHPKFVQELLGHANVSITLDTYSHMLPGMGGEAAEKLGEALRQIPVVYEWCQVSPGSSPGFFSVASIRLNYAVYPDGP